MRDLKFEIHWFRPGECRGLRAWLHRSWHFECATRRYDGFRVCGLEIQTSWMWMTDEEYEEWSDLCREKYDEIGEPVYAGPPDDFAFWMEDEHDDGTVFDG